MDQTLVEFIDIHNKALKKTLKKIYGVTGSYSEIDFAGKTLHRSIREIAELKGVKKSAVSRKIKKALNAYNDAFIRAMPKRTNKQVLPGVRNLLKSLKKRKHLLAIVSGDAEIIGKRVLKNTKLSKYFDILVFGGKMKTKERLAKVVLRKSKKLTKEKFNGKDIVFIGDSIHDIHSGKLCKALTIAVQTGPNPRQKLLKAKPDYIFKNLKNTKKVVEAISGK